MKFCLKLSAMFFLSLFQVSELHAAVWVDKQNWNSQWEEKFSSWVSNEFNEDIFLSGKYKGIPTDCADAVYFSRLIFSAENNLPFVIKDPTGGSSRISNKMSRFDNIKDPIQRLKKFMLFIAGITGTKSLPNDTYPVKINRDNVRPGTIWSRPRIKRENIINVIFGTDVKEDPGHAEIIKDVYESGAIDLIGSTVPAAIRKLQTTSSFVFLPIETTTGFRRWYLPEEYNLKPESIPNYSLEQFKMGEGAEDRYRSLDSWSYEVRNRLKLKDENKADTLNRVVRDLCTLSTTRAEVIKKSEMHRLKLNGTCMDAAAYDSYSTPSRDSRIRITLQRAVNLGGGFGFTTNQRMNKLESLLNTCEIEIQKNRKISLWSFLKAVANDDISSDPNETLEARWGLAKLEKKDCPDGQ